jgi:AcrR family transcriptional regulator
MDAKEKIMEAATALIGESAGDIGTITVRAIAERAHVGVGLVNYHFQTKENLIELCVQRLIGSYISQYRPNVDPNLKGAARLAEVAKSVADYLAANASVSQLSILGDLRSPGIQDNTMKTVAGFIASLSDTDIPDGEKKLLMLVLTAALQSLFLRRNLCIELFGADFNNKAQRDAIIELIVGRIIGKDDKK